MIVFSRPLKWRPISWVFGGYACSGGGCSVRCRQRAGCISSASPVSDGTSPSRHGSQQLGQTDEIVRRHGKGELVVDLVQSAMARLAQSGDGFGPAESLLDPLADAQADLVAGMARCPAIDHRTPTADVLRHMRGDVEILCIESLPHPISVWLDQGYGGQAPWHVVPGAGGGVDPRRG